MIIQKFGNTFFFFFFFQNEPQAPVGDHHRRSLLMLLVFGWCCVLVFIYNWGEKKAVIEEIHFCILFPKWLCFCFVSFPFLACVQFSEWVFHHLL